MDGAISLGCDAGVCARKSSAAVVVVVVGGCCWRGEDGWEGSIQNIQNIIGGEK